MAHYAYLDTNNIVVTVIVGKDENELIDGLTLEIYYAQNTEYTVKRTSYNNKIRKQFAGIGFTYDPINDVFIQPQPYPSWTLNTEIYEWEPPISEPELTEEQKESGSYYEWNEVTQQWNLKSSS